MSNLLYHYCSSQTGFSILKSRTFRLSALSAANDSLEGRVVGKVFNALLEETDLPRGVVDVASAIVEGFADSTEGFAFCLSEQGDLLSQWRAYACDGMGISIGFDPVVLNEDYGQVTFGAQYYEEVKVEYGENALRKSLSPLIDRLLVEFSGCGEFVKFRDGSSKKDVLRALADENANMQGAIKGKGDDAKILFEKLLTSLSGLHFRIYNTKPHSFHEEQERRLLRYRHHVALGEIEYYANEHSVRPFISCLIADPAKSAIQEVILGPKNKSNVAWFRAFLTSVGLEHVRVIKSSIGSYR